jgi:hypothetical protein
MSETTDDSTTLPFFLRSDEGILLVDEKQGAGLRPTTHAEEALREQIMRLQEVLREVEWNGYSYIGIAPCPSCGRERDEGHAPDCSIAITLAEGAS